MRRRLPVGSLGAPYRQPYNDSSLYDDSWHRALRRFTPYDGPWHLAVQQQLPLQRFVASTFESVVETPDTATEVYVHGACDHTTLH
jgi:hypothetical protein